MRKHFNEELKKLKNHMLTMGSLVEESIHDSIKALKEQNLDLAEEVINKDDDIDSYEIKLEEMCTKLIALQQPVAKDLRTIIAISKIVTDLERIGDHASNIARMVQKIGENKLIKPLIDIPRMLTIVTQRLKNSLDAFVNLDIDLAKKVARQDEEVDLLDEQILRELITYMLDDSLKIEQAIYLIFISRFLERIGDHSTNICERVLYIATGEREEY